jgi:predicted nuclease of predicted toxin-antitoxin system
VTSLLLDAGLPRGAATDLRALGWHAVHVADEGLASASDPAILAAAAASGRTVVTLDHDFTHLLFLDRATGPSVILVRIEGLDRRAAVELLGLLLPQIEEDLAAGAVVSVDRSGARVRRLPIA